MGQVGQAGHLSFHGVGGGGGDKQGGGGRRGKLKKSCSVRRASGASEASEAGGRKR